MSSVSRGARRKPVPAQRGGMFSRMSAPPMDSMPPIRTSFARGLVSTWSSSLVVGGTVVWLLVEWLVVVALGYPGPFAPLAHIGAPAPLSTATDLFISVGILGLAKGLPLVFITSGLIHSLFQAIIVGLAVETVETGSASRWGAIRGLRAFPVTFATHAFGVSVLFIQQFAAGVGGGGLSYILQLGIYILATWIFAYAPVIAVTEGRRFLDCMSRSIRAARLPGSANLTFAVLYVVPWYATYVATLIGSVPGSGLGVNPRYSAWIFVVVVSLLHVAVIAALAIRYLAIAGDVPDAPARAAPARGGSRSRATARTRP